MEDALEQARRGKQALPSLRDKRRRFTRRRIVEAARACFHARGVASVSAEQIAQAAKVSRATLYLHFAGKDAILHEILSVNLRGVREIFREVNGLKAKDGAALKRWLKRYAAVLREHRAELRLFSVGLATHNEVRTLIDEHRNAIIASLGETFPALSRTRGARHARAVLVLARIDHVAGAAAEEHAPFDIETGMNLAAEELSSLLSC